MTGLEPSEPRGLRCVFVPGWTCPMEVSEIPLEVCRLCLEARRIHASERAKTVKRTIRRAEAPKPPGREELPTALSSLDRRLINDEISMEEYLKRRNEVVMQLLGRTCQG